ncbi:hypothetical protein LguiB_021740 [Lonicera macranthoides]
MVVFFLRSFHETSKNLLPPLLHHFFRGEDTRKNFTDHLYTALVQAEYRTFRDDNEIEKGESLKPELYKAINGSRISIIVFSKNYAASPWCLDELVLILECKKRTSRHAVLPVFYDVCPSEIRKQKGRTGEAFNEHESRFIQKIINWIRGKLRRTPLFVAPYLIGMHSRAKNINKWLQDDLSEGTITIEGLSLDMSMLMKDDNNARKRKYDELLDKASPLTGIHSFFHRSGFLSFLLGKQQSFQLRTDAFEKMRKLRLLKHNYTQLDGRYDNFPENVVWLCWHGFPLQHIPIELSLENLVALDLQHSKLEKVWAGRKFLGSLKILNLSYSERLAKTPYFLGVPNLERLVLKGCVSLLEICESIEFLKKLNLLNLKNCKNLRMLPRNMYKLGSLETLIISGCLTLFAGGNDISITRTANGEGKWWRTSLLLPWMRQLSRGLEILWTTLPRSLTGLSLSNCNLSNDSLPREFSNLSLIKDLDLSFNPFHCLPDCFRSLSSLQSLSLSFCESVDSIFGLPSNLQMLDVYHCSSLRKITFQSTVLHQLDFIFTDQCREMVEIEGIFKREPIEKVDKRIIKNLGIDIKSIKNLKVHHIGLTRLMTDQIQVQGFYEYGIFSTFIPGGEIPNGFSERKKGSVISLIVPLLPNFRIQCFNIFSVYARIDFSKWYYPIGIKINNKTNDLTWMYSPIVLGFPERNDDMTWLSQWNFGNQLESGDEIVVSISVGDVFEVKECGIKIIYEEDNGVVSDDNNKTYFLWKKVCAGDLSELRLFGGTYLVFHHLYRDVYEMQGIHLLLDGCQHTIQKFDSKNVTAFMKREQLRCECDTCE